MSGLAKVHAQKLLLQNLNAVSEMLGMLKEHVHRRLRTLAASVTTTHVTKHFMLSASRAHMLTGKQKKTAF